MKKYKFVLTTLTFYPICGGIENSLFNLSKNLNRFGYKSIILTTDNKKEKKIKPFSFKFYEYKKLDVIEYHFHKNGFAKILNSLLIIIFLRIKYSATYFVCRDNLHSFTTALLGLNSLYLIPGLDLVESKNNYSIKSKLKKFFQIFAIQKSRKIAVLSKFMQKEVIENYNRSAKIINPGFNLQKKLQIQNETSKKSKFSLISVGRFVEHKNFSMLLKTLKLLPEEYKLTLIGFGDLKEQLSNLINKLNLSNRVNFIFDGRDAAPYYKKSSIYVLPSIYEPFGQVLLEAMSYGLKICAFDPKLNHIKTGTSEIVPDYALFLAKNLSPESLAKTVIDSSQQKVQKEKIINYVHSKYSWHDFSKNILKQFEKKIN